MWWLTLTFAQPDAEAVRDSMDTTWQSASALRRSVINGDLQQVHAAARDWSRSLGHPASDEADAPAVLGPLLETVRSAPDLTSAAQGVAAIGAACGTCHQTSNRETSWHPPDAAGAGPMELHRSGSEWMWAGLVAPSDTLFERGLAAMQPAPGGKPASAALAKAVQRAATTKGVARTRAYGTILATCAGCHQSGVTEHLEVPPGLMHARLAAVELAKTAVSAGKRDDWRAAATDLAFFDPPSTARSDRWIVWSAELRRLGTQLNTAGDAPTAARALTSIAAHCGACHQALDKGPAPIREDQIDDNTNGIDLMWSALLSGDTATWELGARMAGADGLVALPSGGRAAALAGLLTPSKPPAATRPGK